MKLTVILLVAGVCALAGCAGNSSPRRAESTPSQSAASYNVQLGVAYLQQGNLALAQEKLERAYKQNSRDPNVHTALALLYDRMGDTKKADAYYRTALQTAPRNPDVSNNYAVYLCKHGRVDEGVQRFEAVANNPVYRTPESAYTNAGVCLRSVKRYDEAQRNFIAALRRRPNYPEAARQLAETLFERGQVPEARRQVDQYLAAFNATPELLLLGVQLARAAGDRLGEERFARKLRVDFPESDQARAVSAPNRGR